MLQKLSKCEVKAHSILREINFGMIWVFKIAIATILETLKI